MARICLRSPTNSSHRVVKAKNDQKITRTSQNQHLSCMWLPFMSFSLRKLGKKNVLKTVGSACGLGAATMIRRLEAIWSWRWSAGRFGETFFGRKGVGGQKLYWVWGVFVWVVLVSFFPCFWSVDFLVFSEFVLLFWRFWSWFWSGFCERFCAQPLGCMCHATKGSLWVTMLNAMGGQRTSAL